MTDTLLPVEDSTRVAQARRAAASLARESGLGERDEGRVSIIAAELAGNIAKHAGGDGYLLVGPVTLGEASGLRILALDRGPGMGSVTDCLRDGYSTAGTKGTGLGAVHRLSDAFDVYSVRGKGCAVLSLVLQGHRNAPKQAAGTAVAGVSVPKPGEGVCGDAWDFVRLPGRAQVLLVDGLGHGPDASAASQVAVTAFRAASGAPPGDVLAAIHGALVGTRGAAALVAELDAAHGELRCAGIGNISGAAVNGAEVRRLVSHGGILGHQVRRIQEFRYPWAHGAGLVLHSDGCSARWSMDSYQGLAAHHPAMVCGVLHRDFGRPHDDSTVVAAKEHSLAAEH